MLGAIIGDIAGTKYEYEEFTDSKNGIINLKRRKEILDDKNEIIPDNGFISDDSVLTIAIADSIINNIPYEVNLKKYAKEYNNSFRSKDNFFKSPFSPGFMKWANQDIGVIGTSQGNGAAMRVSAVGFLFNNINQVQNESKKTAMPSHNSLQAIKGAQAIATTIYLARIKTSKEVIKKYIEKNFNYDLNMNLDTLQRTNKFNGSCDVTVPQAIFIFLEANGFEDAIRKAISIGGDTDTIACMTGGIAEAYYGIPKNIRDKAIRLLPIEYKKSLLDIYNYYTNSRNTEYSKENTL